MSDTPSKKPSEGSEAAKKLVDALIGPMPESYKLFIRALVKDHNEGNPVGADSLRFGTRFCCTGNTRACLYFAATTFHEEKLREFDKAGPHDLMKIFRPLELATIVSSYIIGRKLKKRCDKKEWPTISKRVAAHTEIGAFIGNFIDPIGPGVGMLTGAFRNLAWPAFAIKNLKEFQTYSRNLVTAELLFNGKAETSRWNCTCVDVGAAFLQKFGFGLPLSNGFLHGLQDRTTELEDDIGELDKAFYFAGRWLESMATHAKAPENLTDEKFSPTPDSLEELKSLAQLIKKEGSEFDWMSKGEDDISPKETPELFDKGRPYYGDIELPRHIKEQLEAYDKENSEDSSEQDAASE